VNLRNSLATDKDLLRAKIEVDKERNLIKVALEKSQMTQAPFVTNTLPRYMRKLYKLLKLKVREL
jgi:hypothetical protein